MFEYKLNYTESKMLNGERKTTYYYDIVNDIAEVGRVVAVHDKNENVVIITLRIKWLDTYTASGTARRMLQEIMEGIINHNTKVRVKFNEEDMHTVALLELSGISSKVAFN